MKSKKKKIIVIASVFIVLIVLMIVFLILRNDKKETKGKPEEKIDTGIIAKADFVHDEFITIKGENVYVKENGKIVVKSLTGEVKEKTDFDVMEYDDSDFVLYKKDKKSTLKNLEGKTLAITSKDIATFYDVKTKKSYYQLENNLYDSNGNVILSKVHLVSMIENGLVYFEVQDTYSEVLDLDTNEKFTFYFRHYDKLGGTYDFGDILLVYKDKKYYFYRKSTKTLESDAYEKVKSVGMGYVLSNNSKSVYLIYDRGEVSALEDLYIVNLSNQYYLDYKESPCAYLKNKDGKYVSSFCSYGVLPSLTIKDWYLIPLASNDEDINTVLFPNGDMIEVTGESTFVGDYFYAIDEGVIYNKDGKKIENDCLLDFQKNGNLYTCNDGVYDHFLDNQLNLETERYDDISCHENGFCVLEKDSKKSLWYKNNVVFEEDYSDFEIEKNFIIAYNLGGFQLFQVGNDNTLSLEELKQNNFDFNVDIESIVKEYELEDIRSSIEANQEFFKNYAYIVLNNDKIGNYKKLVFRLFKIVADNKEYLDENYFFYKLKKLNFVVEKSWDNNIAGEFDRYDVKIRLREDYKNDDATVYHELVHFIDYCIDEDSKILYPFNSKYITKEEFLKLSKEDKKKVFDNPKKDLPEMRFIVEAGAEFYSGSYMSNGRLRVYEIPVRTYNALSIIFGYDKMKEIFFSKDGDREFYNLFVSSGKTSKEYDNFIELSTRITYNQDYNTKDVLELLDTLVDLYIANKGKDWMKDNEFCYILSNMLYLIPTFDNAKYTKNFKQIESKYNYEFHSKLYQSLCSEKYGTLWKEYYFTDGVKDYIMMETYNSKERGLLKIEYDFNTGKSIQYEYLKIGSNSF